MVKIAVLLTCHNRKDKTLSCLEALHSANTPNKAKIDIYLLDDGSTDGTGEAVKKQFPKVNVIEGMGDLFWNGGMRLAWKAAADTHNYDFYLWLNDDTILEKQAIIELLTCYEGALLKTGVHSIVAGACRDEHEFKFTYGGRTEDGPVTPNGKLQSCTYINGNAVLIPVEIYSSIGNLSSDYTHAMGDFDYGLRALEHGFKCFTTRKYIAVCPQNDTPAWCNPRTPILKRLKLLHSPKGLNIREYSTFRKKFWGWGWIWAIFKAYTKVIFPGMYNYFKRGIR